MATKKMPKLSKAEEEQLRIHREVHDGDVEAIQKRLDAGLSPDHMVDGNVPLIVAAAGQSNMLSLLLDAGADPNKMTSDGYSALQYARYEENIRMLLLAGADASVKRRDGSTLDKLGAGDEPWHGQLMLKFWRQKKLGMRAPFAHKPFIIFALERAHRIIATTEDFTGFVREPRGASERSTWNKELALAWLERKWDEIDRVEVPEETYDHWTRHPMEQGKWAWVVFAMDFDDSRCISPQQYFIFFTEESPQGLLDQFKESALPRKQKAALEAVVPKDVPEGSDTRHPSERGRRL